MNCRDVRRKLAGIRSGESLEPELESHIKACATCGRALEEDRALWSLLALYEAPPPSAALFARVEGLLATRAKNRARRPWAGYFKDFSASLRSAAAALVVVALGAGAGLWLGTGNTVPAAPGGRAATEGSAAQEYAQFFDVAPPGSITRAYLSSVDPGGDRP